MTQDLQPSTFNLQPTVGDPVFFRLDRGPNTGDWRPAIIVRTWGASAGAVNLLVFTDSINDDIEKTYWATSRSEGQENGNWSHTLPTSIPRVLAPVAPLVDLVETAPGLTSSQPPTEATDMPAKAGSAVGADTTIEPQPTAVPSPAGPVEPAGVSAEPVGPATVSMTASSPVGVDGNRPDPPTAPQPVTQNPQSATQIPQPVTQNPLLPTRPPQPGDPDHRSQP